MAVFELLPSVAVTVALWLFAMVAAAVALNVAVVAPAATVTEVGTVSKVLLLPSVTATPPVGAAWLIVTVQVDLAPPLRLPGVQEAEERIGTRIVPPVPVMVGSPVPVESTPIGFERPIGVVLALGAIVT